MFISKEQLEQRLNSSKNVLNIIQKKNPESLSPSEIPVPLQDTVPVKENLPDETNKQRAARHARFAIAPHEKHGEYTVNPNITNDIVRATVGILASDNSVSSQQIQAEFGITKNQVIGAKNSKRKGVQRRIEDGRNRVSELAIDRLMETLNLLDPVSLIGEKPKDLATIASSLAKVVASVRNDVADKRDGTNVNVVVYAPAKKELSSYSTIDV